MTDPAAPPSLERTRLLLGWLRAQRAVDLYLSDLLAAGPGGEYRVGRNLTQVDALVADAARAYDRYRASVPASDAAPEASAVTGGGQVIEFTARSVSRSAKG